MFSRREFLAGVSGFPLLAGSLSPRRDFRIAFGSCAEQDRPQPIWDVIAARRPDVFAFLGDNIYGDTLDMAELRAKYAQLGAQPVFARFRRKVPLLATWDDHDYGWDDSGADFPHKHESKEIFLEFFGVPKDSKRRSRDGIYGAYRLRAPFGWVQVLLLDLRWFRSPLKTGENGGYVPDRSPEAQLLGEAQWAWLEERLREPAAVRVLASSVQLVSSEHPWERWACFPRDKSRLYRLLDRLSVRNLVVISGDMHFAELSVEHTAGGIPVYDLTSSGLNRFEPGELYPNRHRAALFDQDCNFGMLTFSSPSGAAVEGLLQAMDSRGRVRIEKRIGL